MAKYRKKPEVVDAVQFNGRTTEELDALFGVTAYTYSPSLQRLGIQTRKGEMNVHAGDWIIRGATGELFPCKPDIFEATYEPAE